MTRYVNARDLPTEWHRGRLYAIVPSRMTVDFEGRYYLFTSAGRLWINPPRPGERQEGD